LHQHGLNNKLGNILSIRCSKIREGVLVGQKQGSTTNPEQAIWDEHGPLIAKVPVLRDILGTHNQSPTARVYLHSHNTDNFTFVFIALPFSPQSKKLQQLCSS